MANRAKVILLLAALFVVEAALFHAFMANGGPTELQQLMMESQ